MDGKINAQIFWGKEILLKLLLNDDGESVTLLGEIKRKATTTQCRHNVDTM